MYSRANVPWRVINKLLGSIRLDGIPAGCLRDNPKVEVTFDIDANGIMNVTARDQMTDKEQKSLLPLPPTCLQEDIDRAMRDAENHSGERPQAPKKEADIAATKQTASATQSKDKCAIWETESPPGKKQEQKMLVADLRQKLKDEADLESVKQIMNELRGALVLLQQTAACGADEAGAAPQEDYTTGGGDGGAAGGYQYGNGGDGGDAGYSSQSGEDVVDAEFRASDD